MNWEAELVAEGFGEGAHLFGLRAFGAAHAEREADDDLFDFMFADYLLEGVEVVAFVLAMESFEALGGDAEGVGDGDADAAGADVEAKDAAGRFGIGCHGGIISGLYKSA